MLVQTTVIYVDEKSSDILGKSVEAEEYIIFDLASVSGMMPGPKDKEVIIFLEGQDLTVKFSYEQLKDLWIEAKGYEITKTIKEKHEG